jgi:8-oxo-dGTP pyrophosphatase MutT (NUDIX family)
MLTSFSFNDPVVFGSRKPHIDYVERRAAYVVAIEAGNVALVGSGRNRFLPGGGSSPGEAAEMTVAREVREELGWDVRLLYQVGAATQYFYSQDDDLHYEMLAVFVAGELTNRLADAVGEHSLEWLPIAQATESCYHECHAWAIRQSNVVAQQLVGPESRERVSQLDKSGEG